MSIAIGEPLVHYLAPSREYTYEAVGTQHQNQWLLPDDPQNSLYDDYW